MSLVILQPVKLPRAKTLCSQRRFDDDFDDIRRPTNDLVDSGAQRSIDLRQKLSGRQVRWRAVPHQYGTDRWITLLGRTHGFDHIAKERRMQVTKETDEAAIRMF